MTHHNEIYGVCGGASPTLRDYSHPHKVSDIKNAIIKLHDNPELAKEMVEKGIENVKRYDWKKEAQKLVDVAREF